MRTLAAAFYSEIQIRLKSLGDLAQSLIFFVLMASIFPLSLPYDKTSLSLIASGVIWVSVLLSITLGLNDLFASDYRDGVLEQIILSERSTELWVAGKILAHWFLSALPIVLFSPVMAYVFALDSEKIPMMFLLLLIGTLIFCFIGSIGSMLTLGLRQGGMLVSLLILPLYIPVLIFGSGTVSQANDMASAIGPLYLLSAILVLSITLSPVLIAFYLKNALE